MSECGSVDLWEVKLGSRLAGRFHTWAESFLAWRQHSNLKFSLHHCTAVVSSLNDETGDGCIYYLSMMVAAFRSLFITAAAISPSSSIPST